METIDEEEMKEQLAEEMAKYEEEGYFKRLGKMFAGLGRPHASREYKEAVIELQRQIAPLLAILVPLVGAAILFVVTAMGDSSEQKVKVEIAQVEKEEQLDEPEQPPETEPTPDTEVDVQMDSPNVSPVEVAEVVPPTAEPQSVKVASVDAMLNIKSPVTMKSVAGTARNAGVRGRYTGGGAQYGDANTERAVLKALRWLKLHQNSDGSWPGVKPASTGLAILTYLAHGETPSSPEFGKTVERGLEFLIHCIHQNKEGKAAMAGSDGHEYAFLIGTYALCEAYGMTKNPNARTAAEKWLGLQHEGLVHARRPLLRRLGAAGHQGRQDGGHPPRRHGGVHQEGHQVPADAQLPQRRIQLHRRREADWPHGHGMSCDAAARVQQHQGGEGGP